jgi:hypothetical protein
MKVASYTIAFDFLADNGRLKVHLLADVELHHSRPLYVIRNFKTAGQQASALPELHLKKVKDLWVHADSEKATDLSMAIGRAIEAHEQGAAE